MKKLMLIGSLFLALPSPTTAHAFNEPDNFMGIKFFSEMGESINQCKRERHQPEADTKLCFYPEVNGRHMIKYVDIGFGYMSFVDAYTVAKKFAKLNLAFGLTYYPTVVPIFRERYGQPTRMVTETWTSRAGTSVPNEIIFWEGKRVSITIRQRSDRVDMSSIVYETDIWRDHASRKHNEWVKEKAKGL
jgi:hypothetical protein